MFETLRQASIFALLCLTVPVVPLVMAFVYAIRPTESRLAMVRPLSLAAIFASISGASLGAINVLRFTAAGDLPLTSRDGLVGLSEAMVMLFTGFGCLTVAWLLVAIGLRRQM